MHRWTFSSAPVKRVMMLVPLMMLVAACQTTKTNTSETSRNVTCEAFQPIRYSRTDTEQTRRQIVQHNAVWDEICASQ